MSSPHSLDRIPSLSNRLIATRRSSAVIINRSLRVLTGIEPLQAKATIQDFQAFHEYARHTSYWRMAAVLFFTPLPSLLTSLAPVFVPLQDPTQGVLHNTRWLIHATIVILLTFIGVHMVVRVGAGISHDAITNRQGMLMSIVSTPLVILSTFLIAWKWKFPIPLVWVVCLPIWFNAFVIGFLVVYRTQLWSPEPIRQRVVEYVPFLAAQIMPLCIYTMYCVVFDGANNGYQMIILFPLLKHVIKHGLKHINRHRTVESRQVASQAVEICASMFQAMVLQTSPSVANTAIIMASDALLQSLHLRLFMNTHGVVDSDKLMETAKTILASPTHMIEDNELRRFSSPVVFKSVSNPSKHLMKSSQVAIGDTASLTDMSLLSSSTTHSTSIKNEASDRSKRIVVRALEIMQASEGLLFVEYLEVIIPMISSTFVVIASQVPSAIYNSKISPYYCKTQSLRYTISNIALFIIMQALSLVILVYVIWQRFRLPAIIHLAYVLERRKWAIQGHMIAWFAVILHFSVKHYGSDMSVHNVPEQCRNP